MTYQHQSKTAGVTIEISGLTKVYKMAGGIEVKALQRTDWKVDPGQVVVIMGPSGCGKTTLLNMLAGIDYPSNGKVVVGGQDLGSLGEDELSRYRLLKVGYVFQFFNLVPTLSALENLEIPTVMARVPRKERLRRSQELLKAVGLEGKGQKRPEELSGGEQQRLAICLALANDPPLICADEPTGNLDTETGKAIVELLYLLANNQGKTVVIASHDPKMIEEKRPAKICHMRDGRIIEIT